MNAPRPKDPINTLSRDEQALIFRLRTKHVPLNNHLNTIKKDHPSQCPSAEPLMRQWNITFLTASN